MLLKSLESSKTENFWIPKMTLGFMMNPNEPHWGSSWTPMNPKVYGIHDFKKFSIATFPDRKMNDFSRIPNCWHDRIETRRWRRSRDSDSFWSHFRIVSKHVLICISMWSFGTEIIGSVHSFIHCGPQSGCEFSEPQNELQILDEPQNEIQILDEPQNELQILDEPQNELPILRWTPKWTQFSDWGSHEPQWWTPKWPDEPQILWT